MRPILQHLMANKALNDNLRRLTKINRYLPPVSTDLENVPHIDKFDLDGNGRKVFFQRCQMNNNDADVVWAILKKNQNLNSYRNMSSAPICNVIYQTTNLSTGAFKAVYKLEIGGPCVSILLDKLSEIDPEMRIGFTSPQPKDFPDEVLSLIGERIGFQLPLLPLSGSTAVFERMRRRYTREAFLDLVVHKKDEGTVQLVSVAQVTRRSQNDFQDRFEENMKVVFPRLEIPVGLGSKNLLSMHLVFTRTKHTWNSQGKKGLKADKRLAFSYWTFATACEKILKEIYFTIEHLPEFDIGELGPQRMLLNENLYQNFRERKKKIMRTFRINKVSSEAARRILLNEFFYAIIEHFDEEDKEKLAVLPEVPVKGNIANGNIDYCFVFERIIFLVAEAKGNVSFADALGQAIAEVHAVADVQNFEKSIPSIFATVTNGYDWIFLKYTRTDDGKVELKRSEVYTDSDEVIFDWFLRIIYYQMEKLKTKNGKL